MKANKEQLLRILASLYHKYSSLPKALEYTYQFTLISKDDYDKIILSLKQSGDLKIIFDTLKVKPSLSKRILFLANFYTLDQAILMGLDYQQNIQSIKKDITSSLVYPIVLIISTLLTMSYIIQSLLPKLLLLNKNSLDKYALLITVLKIIPLIGFIVCISMIFILISILLLNKYKQETLFKLIDSNKLSLMIYRKFFSMNFLIIIKEILVYESFSSKMFEQLHTFFKSSIHHYVIIDLESKFKSGESYESLINHSKYIDRDLKNILLISHDSSTLKDLLNDFLIMKINFYKMKVKSFLSIFVPIIILCCSVIIITLYMLIMLPTLEMA